jgi:hypothetical protein
MPDDIIAATADGEIIEQGTEQVANTGDTAQGTQTTQITTQEKTFTQAQLDEIVTKRLEKERLRLEGQYKSDPRYSFVETQARKFNMTVEQYLEAVKRAEEQESLNELVQQNIPEEYAKEMLENRKFRSEYQAKEQAREAEEKQRKEYVEFLGWYSETYGRDADPAAIPQEVWQAAKKKGASLKAAYMEYAIAGYRAKEVETEKVNQSQEVNAKNAQTSAGSAKNTGNVGGFITKETFDANKHDMNWVRKNLETLEESKKKW